MKPLNIPTIDLKQYPSATFTPGDNFVLGQLLQQKESAIYIPNEKDRIQTSPVMTVISGKHQGENYANKHVVINPGMFQNFVIINFKDGEFIYMPSFAILGTIINIEMLNAPIIHNN